MKSLPALVVFALLAVLLFFACGEGGTGGSGVAVAVEDESTRIARIDAMLVEARYDDVVNELQSRFDAGESRSAEALRLALAREGKKEVPKAVRVLRTALERDPGAVDLSLRLARIYRGLRLPERSLKTLEAAREAGGGDAELALELAVLRGLLEDFEGAQAELERARAAGAPESDVDFNFGVLARARGDLPRAEAFLRGIVERGPVPNHVIRELARVRLDQAPNDPERAIEARDLVNTIPEAELETDWRAWELLGDCEMVIGDPTAAQLYYTYALKHGQSPPRVEDKYRYAVRTLQEELREAGLLPEVAKPEHAPPPLGANFEEQNRLAREARERAEKEAEKGEGDGN